MADQMQEIQEDLIEYFKDMDDKTFMDVCDVIAFHLSTNDSKISQLAEKFLSDNGLHQAYLNYLMELKNPSTMFARHPSDVELIGQIKQSLLALAYNRFRRSMSKAKMSAPLSRLSKAKMSAPLSRLSKGEKDDLTMVIKACERENDDLMDNEEITRDLFSEDEANDIIDERKRLKKLYPKVLKIIK